VRKQVSVGATPVLALDLPGHGARAGEPLLAPRVAAYAAWVRDHLHTAGITHAVLAGHSLGSAIALRLALDHPALITHAVLIGAGARLRVLPAVLDLARSDPARAMTQLVELGHAPEHAELARAYHAALAPTAPGALANDLAACDDFDVMSELPALRVPTSILVGAHDRLTPPKYAQYLADHIAGARLQVLPDAGHYVMDEAPAAVAAALSGRGSDA
jgi:pimeloyl-ACP methyl ester carboxylesterase